MIVLALRLVLALVFIAFGGMKLLDLHGFVGNVENFQIPPFSAPEYAVWLAYFLVPLELLVGASLLTGMWLRAGALLSLGMSLSFMVAIGSVWARGLNIDCGCAGGEVSLGGYPTHMTILAAMLGVSVYLIIEQLFPAEREELSVHE